jgi:SpoVK/Ycf46/Vps4 family AAA+-type ATPase
VRKVWSPATATGVVGLVGPPDLSARTALWKAPVGSLDQPCVDVGALARSTDGYTPGDVEIAAQRAAAAAFDRIREGPDPSNITANDLTVAVERNPPSVTADIRGRFCGEVDRFARV